MSSKKKERNAEEPNGKVLDLENAEIADEYKQAESGPLGGEDANDEEDIKTDSVDSAEESESDGGSAGAEEPCTDSEEDEDLKTRYLRLAADFQNYKRRAEKERGDIYLYANEKLISDLLPVLDNFERAMEHSENSPDRNFVEGMELILKQFLEVLSKNKLEEIEAVNTEFDPSMHDAVLMESVEGVAGGTVTRVIQKGYMLNQKVIRPSMVAVSQ